MNQSLTLFTAIVQQYQPILHRYAACIIKNTEEAESVAAKALVLCWNNRTQLNTAEEIRKFLKTKTKTLCHQWLHDKALEKRGKL